MEKLNTLEKLNWKTTQRKVSQLLPFEQNPRKMTQFQVEKLTRSLERFNLVEVPAIDIDNRLVAGHQRMKVMQLLGRGEEMIDVRVPNRKLTEQEFKEYNVISNQVRGTFDTELLAGLFEIEELKEIGFTDIDLGMSDLDSAFNNKEIDVDGVEGSLEKECPRCHFKF